jgi:Carbohydrate binding domain
LQTRVAAAGVLFALTITACSGGAGTSLPTSDHHSAGGAAHAAQAGGTNIVANPGFETGSLSSWSSCGSTSEVSVQTSYVHSGSYAVTLGSGTKPEVSGTAAVCQTVTVPSGGTLSFWAYEGTNDTISYVDQEADIQSTSGSNLTQLFKEAKSTSGWVQKSFDVSAYAGQTVRLYFAVKGNGYASDFVFMDLDDVSLTGSGSSTPTPSPTATPTGSPTATPAPTPTPGAYPCNNQQFLTDQSRFAAGQITADQFEDVCGSVTQVLPAKTTSSGRHGYFYVAMPSGYQIEIVSNLDAMAQAPTNQPPSTWPWVAVGNYVFVQGRYYYDNSSSQGIDWTEDDTSSSWQHVGWVVVCDNSGNNCNKYW